MYLSRRAVLRLLASSGGAAIGNAAWPMVESSPRPKPRPSAAPVFDAKSEIRDLISKANLKGEFGFQVFDLAKGTALDAENPDQTMPPASTAKAITTAYAFDRLGPGHQLSTRVLTNGQIRSGVLEGDLYLIGGGDPTLSSDHLYGLASDIAALGVRRITGKFGIWAGDLPFIPTIDPDQPPQVGYSPAISGLGVNYNRVHFSWARQNNGYDLQFDARTATRRPKTAIATMSLADRALPVFEYHLEAETAQDAWSVARSALGEAGSRWLPVRDPALYAGQVFQSVASEAGISLPAPIILDQSPKGATLATLHSPNFTEMARGLLRYSNNLTAEIMGLTASAADGMMPQNLAQSAMMMNNWAANRLNMTKPGFVDHSGLGDGSRVSAADMVRGLAHLGYESPLKQVLRQIPLKQENGAAESFELYAKTGTLNFVNGLVGYIARSRGQGPLAFAIYFTNLDRRAAIPKGQEENPPGAKGWARRARKLQYDMVRLWARMA